MTDNESFEDDILCFLGQVRKPRPVFKPDRTEDDMYDRLCGVCLEISAIIKRRMPDHIHNRIVLGRQNRSTREYLKMWGV